MKLFRKRDKQGKKADEMCPPVSPAPSPQRPPAPREISLSTEHKSILEKPIDPRVDRILQEIYDDRAAAERALKARRIIEFPHSDSGQRHVVRDKDGSWRIVPGPAPADSDSMRDAL